MQTSNLFYWNKCITMITYLVSGIYTYFNGINKAQWQTISWLQEITFIYSKILQYTYKKIFSKFIEFNWKKSICIWFTYVTHVCMLTKYLFFHRKNISKIQIWEKIFSQIIFKKLLSAAYCFRIDFNPLSL